MKAILFNPEEHFTPSDVQRIKAVAAKHGVNAAELIETTIKRRIWSAEPQMIPPPQKAGKRRLVTA